MMLAAGLFLAGCATPLPQHYEAVPSVAYANPQDTDLGRFIQPDLKAHPGKNGVRLLSQGRLSFKARLDLAAMAEKTLDLQYYRWAVDTSGSILAAKVMRAADRGVRVRILIDDINTANSDFKFARMDFHPNIEIRLFNPFRRRGFRLFDFVTDLDRLNHRMHNKAFIADNAVAVVGGRNIGDEYFDVDPEANFRDLDVTLVGPVVREISTSFDEFWNSEWAIPVNAIVKEKMTADEFKARQAKLYAWVAEKTEGPYTIGQPREAIRDDFNAARHAFIWAPARVLYDSPWKIDSGHDEVATGLRALEIDAELLMEAAYLIVGETGIENAGRLNARGVRVRILTNSLATNDVVAAHSGYANYRKDLIRNGVELFELRPDSRKRNRKWSLLSTRSIASLHTKVFVIDAETTVVGSYNTDPRSRDINTEIVVMIESAELAAQVKAYMASGVAPQASYRVTLEKGERGFDRLVWTTEANGATIRFDSEPEAGFWQRFSAWFISLLPIEDQL
ncbi:MAG: phospholipase D family protein [Desulfobacterales bacterium]|nr:phospholipase D family protein [Desulfobacterales bacterium]